MGLLIFNELRVPLDQFRHPSASKKFWNQMREAATSVPKVLGSFPIPARKDEGRIDQIRFYETEIVFPHPGEFYFYCDLGVFKVLILDPEADEARRVLKIFSFVSKNIIHSRSDAWLFLKNGEPGPFYWCGLFEKFFFSDQPLHLHCGDATNFLAAVLHAFGLQCRLVHLIGGKRAGHILAEVWSSTTRKWIALDPDFGVGLAKRADADATGLLSAQEICEALEAPNYQELSAIDFAQKNWSREDYNLPRRFMGIVSWHPGWQTEQRAGDTIQYLQAWRECLGFIKYEAFVFDDNQHSLASSAWAAGGGADMCRLSLSGPYRHVEGYAWIAELPEFLHELSDNLHHRDRSPLRLVEDGRVVGQGHSVHQHIVVYGTAKYSHWAGTLYFSASDNSDPNCNGHQYELIWSQN